MSSFYILSVNIIFHRNFTPSNSTLPKLSFIPTCFFGKEAQGFWKSKDYDIVAALNNIPTQEYREIVEEHYKLRKSDFYRYPKCTKFVAKPTDTGICHTFNGLEINKILKQSNWLNDFKQAFGDSASTNLLMSGGIDIEEGFVFSLDTLQSFFVTMKERVTQQSDISSFWLKVHTPGEIPWIQKDKSTWKKIEAYGSEMSTRYISLKGEKIDYKVGKYVQLSQT